jgi:hypothetical protein
MPENTGEIQENVRFKKGKSGNPGGKQSNPDPTIYYNL